MLLPQLVDLSSVIDRFSSRIQKHVLSRGSFHSLPKNFSSTFSVAFSCKEVAKKFIAKVGIRFKQ